MKTLQNNFTTPEQSKRLLELGVPADSADCVLARNLYFPIGEYEIKVLDGKYSRFIEMHDTWEVIPCWSVGRLIEICDICILAGGGKKGEFYFDINKTYVQNMVDTFEGMLKLKLFDFSKMEE